jgi:Skp family chaperone for outer membrane proteins
MRSFLLFWLLLFSVHAHADPESDKTPHRVGFVNVADVLNNSLQVKKLESELKVSYESRKSELDKEQEKLNTLEKKLADEGEKMTFEERSALEHQILSLRSRIKQELTWLEEDITIRKSAETGRLIKLLREVIEEVAKEKQIDLIFEGAVVYTSDRVDLSDDVSERLKKHFYENGKSGK